jgi:Na+/H+-translocating membrane pyrophosphatase
MTTSLEVFYLTHACGGVNSVGDPFKDTAGPSLHVLIKMLATITLVMAPLFLES